MATKKDTTKVPAGFKKLSTEVKTEKTNEFKWDPRPSISLKEDDLPEMKNWKVPGEYTLEIRVKMEEYGSRVNLDTGKTETQGCFRILGVKAEAEEE